MKIHRLLIAGLACAFIAATFSSAPEAASKSPHKRNKTLRVLYWNIQNGMWDGQSDNYCRFVEWVNKKQPDICIFCEAGSLYTDSGEVIPKAERYLPDHWGDIAARWGHSYWLKGAHRDSHPQAVTSRFPIDSVGTSIGSGTDTLVMHGSGWFQVHVDGLKHPLNIVTCHTKPNAYGYHVPKEKEAESAANFDGEKFRRKEVEYICNHTVRTRPNAGSEYWIMAGDFNSVSRKDNFIYRYEDSSMHFLTQDYMAGEKTPYFDLVAEMHPGVFCPSCGPGQRIDFFYVTRPLLNACAEVYTQPDSYTSRAKSGVKYFWRPSDHFPIIVDFDLSKLK